MCFKPQTGPCSTFILPNDCTFEDQLRFWKYNSYIFVTVRRYDNSVTCSVEGETTNQGPSVWYGIAKEGEAIGSYTRLLEELQCT